MRTIGKILTLSMLALLCLFPGSRADAAGGDLNWAFVEALPDKQDTRASAIDSSGSLILVGVDGEGSGSNGFIAKVTPDGQNLTWPIVHFDRAGGIDVATAVAVDGNDDILVTGYGHNGSNYDIQTLKISGSAGNVIWSHSYAGSADGNDIATAIGVDALHNVYVGGYSQNSSGEDDFIVLKYQADGPINDAPLWATPFNGSGDGHDRLLALAVGSVSLAIAGETESATPGNFDLIVHELLLDGTFAWPAPSIYSDTGNSKGVAVAIDGNNDVIVTGYVDDGIRNLYTAKHAGGDGATLWAMKKSGETVEGGHALVIDSNNDVYVTGSAYSVTTAYDVYTAKFQGADPVGGIPVVLWEDHYNLVNGNHDIGVDLALDAGGDLYVTAYSNDAAGGFDDILLIKYGGSDGARLWPQTMYDLEGRHNRPVGIDVAADGSILVGGWADTAANSYELIALNYDAGAIDPPTGLSAAVLTNSSIELHWTDNSIEDNFIVERRSESEPLFGEIATLGADTVSYVDSGLLADHRYYYRVKAFSSGAGNSAWSNIADVRTTVISYDAPGWLHLYAGSDAGDDDPAAIAAGPDGDPVVTGSSFSLEGGFDYLTLKLDRNSPSISHWEARYNDGDNEGDTAKAVVVDSQNRVVVTGFASLYGGGASNTNDIYTLGYPADGPPPAWDDQYNGPDGNDDKSAAIAVTTDADDNTAVVGYGKNAAFDNDIYVLKFDSAGNRLWAATPYDSGGEDYPSSVAFDAQGNVFVAGHIQNGSTTDWFVARYAASDGTRTHTAPLHAFSALGDDIARSLVIDAAGDVYVTGVASNGSNSDIYTVKYAGSDLAILWQQAYDSGNHDTGANIGIDPVNGDILVAGTSTMGVGNNDFRLIRYTAAGSAGHGVEIWNHRVDLPGSDDELVAMAVDLSGVATLTGDSDSDILTLKIDHNETISGANIFNGSANDLDFAVDVAVNRFGEAFVAGASINADTVANTDLVVFKVNGDILQAPTPLTASQLYAEVSLSWADNDLDSLGFRLERKLYGCASTEPWQPVGSFGAGVTETIDTPVNSNTAYCYRIQSFDASDASRWVEVEVTTADPIAPADLTAELLSDTVVRLGWTDHTTDATGYNFVIERCAGNNCDFSVRDVTVLTATEAGNGDGSATWIDSSVCSGQAYRYRVKAEKPGLWTTPFSTPTPSEGITPVTPAAPTGLTADRSNETLVDISWIDNSDGEELFVIERCLGDLSVCASGSWSTLGTLSSLEGNQLALRLDEPAWNGTPGEVIDLSGYGHAGVAVGASTTTYGHSAGGALLAGGLDHIETPLVVDQSATSTGATFAAWVKPQSSSGLSCLFDTDNGGNDWGLLHNNSTWLVNNGDDSGAIDTGVAVDLDSWQHIALTFDTAAGVRLFKNGILAWSSPIIHTDDDSAPLSIGFGNRVADQQLFYAMDEATWSQGIPSVLDSSGNGRHGTPSFTLDPLPAGHYGNAGSFNGSSDYISTGLTIDQSPTSPGVTFEAWIKPTDATYTYRHIFSTDNGDNDWSLIQYGSQWRVTNGTSNVYATSADIGRWQHIAVVFDPQHGTTILYKNGVATTNLGIGTDASSNPVTLGRHANTASNYFVGLLDSVGVSSRALTGAEVSARYQRHSIAGIVDEVNAFNRALDASESAQLATHGVNRYIDTTIAVNSDYSYRVHADRSGSCGSDWPTAASAPIDAVTSPLPPEVTATREDVGRVRLDWLAATTTHDGFRIDRCVGSGCTPDTLLTDTLGAGVSHYVDQAVCSGETYRYQMRATSDNWGASPPSATVEASLLPLEQPVGLGVVEVSEGQARLTWSHPDPSVSGYRVGYCTGSCLLDTDFIVNSHSGLPAGAEMMLHMDETTWVNGSSDIVDSSSGGHPGTSYNGATVATGGRYGWAGVFDGSNDYVSTTLTVDQSDNGAGATFEAWVYPTVSDGSYRYVISTENGGYDWGILHYNGTWYISTGAGWVSTGIAVDRNQWQHVAASFLPGGNASFYKNGGAVPANIYTTAAGTDVSSNAVYIGRQANSSYYFAGRIDEVAVYSRELSANEILGRSSLQRFALVETLTPESAYSFRVWPYRNDLCSSEGPYLELNDAGQTTTSAVPPVAALTSHDIGTTAVELNWTVMTTTENLLRVERCTGESTTCGTLDANFNDFSLSPVALTARATSSIDPSVCAESAYTYRVRAERDSAPLWQSAWTYVERPALLLPTPTFLMAAGLSESEIVLSWDNPYSDDSETVIERCDGPLFDCGTPLTVKTEPGLSLLYHFDEGAWVNGSADVIDTSGNGYHGTSYNGAAVTSSGHFANAGNFSSNSDYVVSPLNIDQSATSPGATFQAWVYPTSNSTGSYWHVISTENGGYDWSLVHYNGFWYIFTGSNVINTGKTVDLNQWQHVAAVFDPAAGVRFYKNGGEQPADIYTNTTIGFDDSDANVTIGRYASSTSTSYNYIGLVDEVAVSERPLSAGEILANYRQAFHSHSDSGLTPGSVYSYRVTTVKTVTDTLPDGCDWEKSALAENISTLAPPAPEQLQVTAATTTSIDLAWIDKSGSETEFQLQRCADTLVNCGGSDLLYDTASFPSVDLPADSQTYLDTCAAPDTIYSYRVRARQAPYVPPGWDTDWIYVEAHTNPVVALSGFSASRISEVEAELVWNDANSDEDGFIIERCTGASCDFSISTSTLISDPSAQIVYRDTGLEPNQSYRFRVQAVKAVGCTEVSDWSTGIAGPQTVALTVAAPNLLSATEMSTTRIDLAWAGNAPSATGTVVERCNGVPCGDAFVEIATAAIGASGYRDETVCDNSPYSYRIKSVGNGLSNDGGSCWTRRAKLNISGFAPEMVFELSIPYDSDMRSDFADLRFFDATAKRELGYWIEQIDDPGQPTAIAHVMVQAGLHDDIWLHYGNPAAASSDNAEAFIVFRDDFIGNAIDGGRWVDLDPNNFIVQDNGLHLYDLVNSGSWSALITSQGFSRSQNVELLTEITFPADTDGINYAAIGWGKDQQSSAGTAHCAHVLYFYNNTEFRLYENGTTSDPGNFRFYPGNSYLLRIVPDPISGATYYVKGGSYSDWTLISDTRGSGSSDPTLRLQVLQNSQQMTVNSVVARKQVAFATVSLGSEEDLGGCFSDVYTWESPYSSEALGTTTRAAQAPTLDNVATVNLTTVELHWTNNSDSDAGFDIERCCGTGCSYQPLVSLPAGSTSYLDSSAPESAPCDYQVYATRTTPYCAWRQGPSNTLGTMVYGAAASGLTATAVNSRLIRLDWNDNADDEDGFEIEVRHGNEPYRNTAWLGPDRQVYYDGRNIEPERTYDYRMRSYRRFGSGEPYSYQWSDYIYAAPVVTPAWTEGDGTCTP